MSAQHTPAPWFTDPNDATKVLKQFRSPKVRNETIAATNRTWMTESEKIGNARLIAAAPDLLEALQRAVDLLARYPKHDEAWRQARAAIAKVEGGAA